MAGPVAIEVLTRPAVSAPTGHSQWYDRTTEERFTPRTAITVNLVDGSPTVAEEHLVLPRHSTPQTVSPTPGLT